MFVTPVLDLCLCEQCRRRGQAQHDKAIVNVQYSVANFSRAERKQFSKNDRFSLGTFSNSILSSAKLLTFVPLTRQCCCVQTSERLFRIGPPDI